MAWLEIYISLFYNWKFNVYITIDNNHHVSHSKRSEYLQLIFFIGKNVQTIIFLCHLHCLPIELNHPISAAALSMSHLCWLYSALSCRCMQITILMQSRNHANWYPACNYWNYSVIRFSGRGISHRELSRISGIVTVSQHSPLSRGSGLRDCSLFLTWIRIRQRQQ